MREQALSYGWLEPEATDDDLGDYGAIKALRYWPDDFLAETRFAPVTKVVHVEHAVGTPNPVDETRWVQAFADRLDLTVGIVARVVLDRDDVASQIAGHADYEGFRGIRDQRYDDYFADPTWRAGFAQLEPFNIVLCDDPHVDQMKDAATLAERHPGVTYCVDHAGYPRERSREYFERWREGMRRLAAVDNTVVKISGLGMCDHSWTVESLRPWVMECIDAWGVDRAFFGTNWPLDRLFSSYGDVLAAYSELIEDLSASEQAALCSGTADRVFCLV